MYFGKKDYKTDMEILATQANMVSFSCTVASAGVSANEEGKKYVLSGSLLDADGNVVTQTGDSGSETLSATPVGVLYKTVDVTYGDQPGSLIVEGYLISERVLDGFAAATVTAIKAALPKITFR